MRKPIGILFCALVLPALAGETKRFDLGDDKAGSPPAGWTFGRTGSGAPGKWLVEDGKAVGATGKVVVQRDADTTDYRFPIALLPGTSLTDGMISVRCRSLSGKVDQACGVVLRAKGEAEYVIARSNALENNVRLYNVTGGRRRQFAGWNGTVAGDVWHELSLSAAGDEYAVRFDGKEVIRAKNSEIPGPGRTGLWTKADSVTAFSDIVVEIRR